MTDFSTVFLRLHLHTRPWLPYESFLFAKYKYHLIHLHPKLVWFTTRFRFVDGYSKISPLSIVWQPRITTSIH